MNVKKMLQRDKFFQNNKLKIFKFSLQNPGIYKQKCRFVHLNIFSRRATIINSQPICEKAFF